MGSMKRQSGYYITKLAQLLFLTCLLFTGVDNVCCQNLESTQKDTVRGAVTDASGAAMGGVLVQAISDDGSVADSATTKADGSYTLNLSPGTYIVRGLLEGKVICDGNLTVTPAAAEKSNLVAGVFMKGTRDTSTRSGPALLRH